MADSAFLKRFEKLGIRQRIRPLMPPLFHEEDVARIAAQIVVTGTGVAAAEEALAS